MNIRKNHLLIGAGILIFLAILFSVMSFGMMRNTHFRYGNMMGYGRPMMSGYSRSYGHGYNTMMRGIDPIPNAHGTPRTTPIPKAYGQYHMILLNAK